MCIVCVCHVYATTNDDNIIIIIIIINIIIIIIIVTIILVIVIIIINDNMRDKNVHGDKMNDEFTIKFKSTIINNSNE